LKTTEELYTTLMKPIPSKSSRTRNARILYAFTLGRFIQTD